VQLSRQAWEELKAAADRYSLTGLKKALEPLDQAGAADPSVVRHLKRLTQEGDLDQVRTFLEAIQVKGKLV